MNERSYQLISKILLSVLACIALVFFILKEHRQNRSALLSDELGITHESALDYENLAHLVFLNRHASADDKELAKASITLANKLMIDEGHLFPRVEYEDAILAYPTPDTVLGFANGFLRVAQENIDVDDPNIRASLGNNTVAWYLKGSKSYFQLAMSFADKIAEPFPEDKRLAIRNSLMCIDDFINDAPRTRQTKCSYVDVD